MQKNLAEFSCLRCKVVRPHLTPLLGDSLIIIITVIIIIIIILT